MKNTEPIRDFDKLFEIGEELKKHSQRDYMLFLYITLTRLNVKNILGLKIKDVIDFDNLLSFDEPFKLNNRLNNSFDLDLLTKETEKYLHVLTDNKVGGDCYMFKSRKGNSAINYKQANRIIKDTAKAIGIKMNVGLLTLKKSYALYQYTNKKISLKELKKFYGHSTLSRTRNFLCI